MEETKNENKNLVYTLQEKASFHRPYG